MFIFCLLNNNITMFLLLYHFYETINITKYYLIKRLSNNFIARLINEFIIIFIDFDIYNANRNVITI